MLKKLIIEGYINYLYDPDYQIEKEWRGPNYPVEEDDRPNWIRECMLLDCDRRKINCLRKLRETAAMNPFYQHRIDRFVDAITQTYEPTDNPGMVPELQEADMSPKYQRNKVEDEEDVESAEHASNKLPWSK